MKLNLISIFLVSLFISSCNKEQEPMQYDLCVYGGTSAGVIAAHTAAQMGKSVLLIEPSAHLGGMSSSGLGSTDIGNKIAVQGLARKFYRDLGHHYGNFENWVFEPKAAEALFEKYTDLQNIKVIKNKRIVEANKENTKIVSITLEDANYKSAELLKISAKQFIDCTYEGDLMAMAGVSYFLGREDNSVYNETLNGVQLRNKHQFPDGIDPYIEEGNPASGLLPGINAEPVQPNGTGDSKLQAYNYRLCLTNNPRNRIPFPEPNDYKPLNYELIWRVMKKNMNLDEEGVPINESESNKKDYEHHWQWTSFESGFIINYMPEEKTDFNHLGGFSIDYIGMNYDYPEASYERRAEIFEEHKQFILGIFHFLKIDPRVPQKIKETASVWGLPKDEFLDNGGWPYYLYVRETRRMIGEYVMTEHNCVADKVVEDPIALAAYTMDSHNAQRVVVNGMVKNEGNVEVGGFGPYPIAYRSLTPKANECTNLLVPVCLSASHIAYGSIRMEPVFMVLGQVTGLAAVKAIEENISVQDVDYKYMVELMANAPFVNGAKPDISIDDAQLDLVSFTEDIIRSAAFMVANNTSYLYSPSSNTDSHITFKIDANDTYDVRYFVPKIQNQKAAFPDSLNVTVHIGQNKFENKIPIDDKRGKFVLVGTFDFSQGEKATLVASPLTDGTPIVADAILLIPAKEYE